MSVSSARTRCGLYMAAKKRPKFDAFVDYAWARGIDIVDLALDDAPDVFTPHLGLDVVLHKFTDDLATAHGDAGAARRLANFEALLASHTHTHLALVDPLPGIRPLLNRAEMQRVLADVIATHAIDADLPKWVAIALNLLPQGKLSLAAVKVQVLHAAQRENTPLSWVSWLDVLVGCEERGIDAARVLDLQEAWVA